MQPHLRVDRYMNDLVHTLDFNLITVKHHDVLVLVSHQTDRHHIWCFLRRFEFHKLVSVRLISVNLLNESHLDFVRICVQSRDNLGQSQILDCGSACLSYHVELKKSELI